MVFIFSNVKNSHILKIIHTKVRKVNLAIIIIKSAFTRLRLIDKFRERWCILFMFSVAGDVIEQTFVYVITLSIQLFILIQLVHMRVNWRAALPTLAE